VNPPTRSDFNVASMSPLAAARPRNGASAGKVAAGGPGPGAKAPRAPPSTGTEEQRAARHACGTLDGIRPQRTLRRTVRKTVALDFLSFGAFLSRPGWLVACHCCARPASIRSRKLAMNRRVGRIKPRAVWLRELDAGRLNTRFARGAAPRIPRLAAGLQPDLSSSGGLSAF
jgi:hypothetical protein